MTRQFFRFFFLSHPGNGATAESSDGAFHSLYMFTWTFGSGLYGLLLQMLIFLILIFTGIAFIKGYLSQGSPQRQESKDMITRNFIILVLGISLTGLLTTLYGLFAWA